MHRPDVVRLRQHGNVAAGSRFRQSGFSAGPGGPILSLRPQGRPRAGPEGPRRRLRLRPLRPIGRRQPPRAAAMLAGGAADIPPARRGSRPG